ncbi:uncharacterized protein LOC129238273 [Anastrepha obliqua]|uniref:uncharacterized protein LOC129238273 n=1 Tax=Anastrepha obliqua TaxID=95512 RepID=UPI0024093612|nr:uncharacterized protein LOC129238273 [Anastrepha obliqua]
MAKFGLCALLALLCAMSLLSSIGAEELSAAEAIIEARNDEAAVELPQPQANQPLAESIPAKSELQEMPIVIVEVDDKKDEEQDKPIEEEALADQEAAAIQAEDSKKKNLELEINAEVLAQPGMARLARHLKSLQDYPVFRIQKSNGLQRTAHKIREYDDDEDDGLLPEERAVRRRKRIRRRNTNNNVRKSHRKQNVSNRSRPQSQRRKSVRKPNVKSSVKRRPSNNSSYHRGNNKSQKKTRSSKPSRKSSKKGSRNTKRKSSQRKRPQKHHEYVMDEDSYSVLAGEAPVAFEGRIFAQAA